MNITECQNGCCRKIWALLLALTLLAVPVGGALAGPAVKNRHGEDLEGAQSNAAPMESVTLKKKRLEAVVTNTGETFAISKETIITGMDGQQVSIREMLVPCDAEISYETKNGVRVAQRIKMVRLGRNSTWKWEANIPE